MCNVIAKLNITTLYTTSTYLYFNAYLVKSIFFGTEIMHLNSNQNKELKLICEIVIYTKLGLGGKFLREILYFNRNSIGIGLTTPKTIVAMLALKLYISNKCAKIKVRYIIEIIDNIIAVEQGSSNNTITKSYSQNKPTWNE